MYVAARKLSICRYSSINRNDGLVVCAADEMTLKVLVQ